MTCVMSFKMTIYIEGIIVLIFLYYKLICLSFITHLIGACTSDGKKKRGRSGGLLSLGCISGSRNKSSSGAKRRPSSVLKKEEQSRHSMNVLTKYQGSGDGKCKAKDAACKFMWYTFFINVDMWCMLTFID